MSLLYFFRHGQAGTRDDYDRLSPLGLEQASRLGQYLAARGVRFRALYCGELRRQRETAQQVAAALGHPEILPEARFNEFDLDAVYRGIAPQMAAEDAEFRQHFEELKRQMASGEDGIHRRWTKADTGVVKAWVQGRYPFDGESWDGFVARVTSTADLFGGYEAEDVIGISTSATPMAIWVGRALELSPRHVMRLAGACHNSAVTMLQLRGQNDLSVTAFNSTAHLDEPRLLTYR